MKFESQIHFWITQEVNMLIKRIIFFFHHSNELRNIWTHAFGNFLSFCATCHKRHLYRTSDRFHNLHLLFWRIYKTKIYYFHNEWRAYIYIHTYLILILIRFIRMWKQRFIRMCVAAQNSLHSYVVLLALPVNRFILLNLLTILRIEFR